MSVSADGKLPTALLDRVTPYGEIVETMNDSWRIKTRVSDKNKSHFWTPMAGLF
jgi:hypothetical protein